MTKPLTLLESVLVQILIQSIRPELRAAGCLDENYVATILVRAGLTKQQANKALGR